MRSQGRYSLRTLLSLQLAAVVLVSISIFAITTKNVIATMQRNWINAHLDTSADALSLVSARSRDADLHHILTVLEEPGFPAAVFDAHGRTVVATGPVPSTVAEAIPRAPKDGSIFKAQDAHGEFRLAVVKLQGTPNARFGAFWHVVDLPSDADEAAASIFFVTVPAIALVAFLIGDILTRRALRPLTDVTAMAKTIEARDLSQRIDPLPHAAELADLCATFNRMLGRLESAFERQRRFTADASHEFRTPLSVIMAEADLVAAGCDSDDEYRRSGSTIFREAQLIESITEDLLALARNEARAVDSRQVVDVALAAAGAADRLEYAARGRRITLHRVLAADAAILADETSITRVAIALLHNAIKFTENGSTVDIEVRTDGKTVQLVVTDQGPGFTEEGLEHAFERFWRADKVRGSSGTGLGLAIVQSLVDRANGTISIANVEPRGSRISVSFPAATQDAGLLASN